MTTEKKMTTKKKWIQSAIKRPGAFTAFAKRHGWSVATATRRVLASKGKFSTRVQRQANLAKTLRKM